MMIRGLSILAIIVFAVFAIILVTLSVSASDAPHWTSASITIDCSSQCHLLHQAAGSTLTAASGNANLCQSCHKPGGIADLLAINNVDSAVPGVSGTSHAFTVPAVNVALGTQTPLHSEMALRVMGGNIVCSTCHDQHSNSSANGGRLRISDPQKTTVAAGTGTLASGENYSGTEGAWYIVRIVTSGTEATSEFQYQKFTQTGGWTAWSANISAGANVLLDNLVTVTFGAGSYNATEQWEFSASYPFLRAVLDSGDNVAGDKFCRDCHRDWVMDHDDSDGDGKSTRVYDGTKKSHPVGVSLAAAYDRAQPLDGDGQAQNAAAPFDVDGNPSNDLRLVGGQVSCLTCHGVHFADGNTLTGTP